MYPLYIMAILIKNLILNFFGIVGKKVFLKKFSTE